MKIHDCDSLRCIDAPAYPTIKPIRDILPTLIASQYSEGFSSRIGLAFYVACSVK